MKILIISDVHGNRVALEAVLADAGTVDELWSLGDIVGYGPEPGWCVDRIAELCVPTSLSGNHDLAAIGKQDSSAFNAAAQNAIAWTSSQLTQEQRGYLASLPSKGKFRGITLAHGSPRSPVWEYVGDAHTAAENFPVLTTDICFIGHTHAAAISELPIGGSPVIHSRWHPDQRVSLVDHRLILNPGSVGQPRDGDPRASYAIFDPAEGFVTLHRTTYDIEAVQRRMREEGLPLPLVDRLARGR